MSDEDSGTIDVRRPIPRPPGAQHLQEPSMLQLSAHATEWMKNVLRHHHLKITEPIGPVYLSHTEASQALRAWLRSLGFWLRDNRMDRWALDQILPLPAGTDRREAMRIFTGKVLPEPEAMVHMLYAIGIAPQTITAAVVLLHQAMTTHPDDICPTAGHHAGTTGFRKTVVVQGARR